MRKTGNLIVKIDEHEKDGKKKGQYKTIGKIMSDGEGKEFILLDATVISMQLFALANSGKKESIIVHIFRDEKNSYGGDTGTRGIHRFERVRTDATNTVVRNELTGGQITPE